MARTVLAVAALVVAAFLAGVLVTVLLGGGNFAAKPENTVGATTVDTTTVRSEAERRLEEACANIRMKLLTTPEGTLSASERTNLERQVRQQCAPQNTTSTTEGS